MSERLLKESDVLRMAFQLPFIVNSVFADAVKALPSADKPQNVIAQITFNEEKLHEIVKEAVKRFKEEYEVTDRPQGEWIGEADGYADGLPVYDMWYCSNCDYAVESDEMPTWKFCPNCGARIKGVDDEAD